MCVKDVERSNNSGSGVGSNSGNPSSSKKTKRSVEVRDALHYMFGSGSVLSKTIQDQAHSVNGVEQSGDCKKNEDEAC